MKYIKYHLVLGLIVTSILACGRTGDEGNFSALENTRPKGQASVVDNDSDKNILQVAMGSEDHTTLVAAVEAAGIEHVLVNAGPLTVFAPVNTAFDALPAGTVDNLLRPENKADLATILTRHAAPGSYDKESLIKSAEKGRTLYMATGDYLEINVDGDKVQVGGATILATIPTSNGIIHVVDSVILPSE
ncbi:fasciclin domain-containing protein [Balneola sp. MJW-20]|uniref:fasciclin domain-containing protein n=1 Tax=Gracilimonas aurantiaca TaxID=3234185 RepID=UPI003466B948